MASTSNQHPTSLHQKQQQQTEHFNIEAFDSSTTFRSEEIKHEYSTFIEELEETTEKLMNEVFNTEYKPEIEDEADLIKQHEQRIKKLSGKDAYIDQADTLNTEAFDNFLKRNEKWKEMRDMNVRREARRKDEMEAKKMREIPQILRGSIEKMEPIYERALDLHRSKEKKRAFKKIQNKKQEQEQFSKHTFHPEITEKNKLKPRTLEEYLRDKQQWQEKKLNSREIRKLQQEASKYNECLFRPHLISKPIENNSRIREGELVEDRLLRSLEKMISVGTPQPNQKTSAMVSRKK